MAQSAARIGKLAGQIIGHAMNTEVLCVAVNNFDMPKNKSDTYVARSWVPYGATVSDPNTWSYTAESHLTQEGVTPAADTITPRDVTIQLNQYMALYSLTDRDADLYEDDITSAMKEQTGERMGLVRELAIYGKMKAATNKFYAGITTVTTRATVDSAVTEKLASNVVRSLQRNHGHKITKVLDASEKYDTTSVEAAYVCYVHTDAEYDIRRLAGFRECAAYGNRKLISDFELGTWQNIRFVVSADLNPITDAGAAVGSTGLKTSGTKVDIYPFVFLSKDAFTALKLRGASVIDPIYLPPGQKDKNDPGGQRGYIGAKFYFGAEILNPGWIAVLEAGVTDLA
jgi:N4-gp56 family major capsid protein